MSQFNLLMRAIAACLALLGSVATAAAQQPARSDTIIARTRVIGVYDSDTGQPIEGAEVRDILTGLSALTSVTGTLVLPMDTAGAFLRVRKLGFNMLMQAVPNGTADTLPITLTMDRAGQLLPTVTSRARGVEVYRVGEIPPQYNATLTGVSSMATGGTNDGCVTLIWTR